ncbi:nitroreductase family protein [uncultured Desulfuromonas sp.]|uniref:nitroreductase family protein n=1 Tax=uncultured Desulfuromonas sp. TaxID=181013 RepID=UPI002AABEC0C|nr:nitroreductase family protein [uncultured Desulfuromonas sp.]
MFLDLLRQRRSIRKFTNTALTEEQLCLLQEAVLRAPSSRGRDPWQFIFVTDRHKVQALSQAKPHGAGFLAEAAVAVIVCADPQCCDVWIEDCSIAAFILQLTAQDLGLGSCWAQIRCREHDDTTDAESYVRRVAGIPDQLRIDAIIGIGEADEEKEGHPEDELRQERIHWQSYRSDT